MLLDERNEFADNVTAPTGTGDQIVGDVIDLGAAQRDPGNGEPLYLVLQASANYDSGTTSVISYKLVSDSTADLATSPTVHFQTGTFSVTAPGDIAAGQVLAIVALPIEGNLYERYLGILQNADVALTAGALNAFLTRTPAAWKAYNAPGQA